MTKQIRVENADTSSHKVRVYIEERHADGTWHRTGRTVSLDHPTVMASEYIHSTQRLVVEEVEGE